MDFTSLIQQYGYLIVYLGGLFEGEAVALLAGFAAKTQHLRLPLVMLCSMLGVFTSDQFCFYCGRFFGKSLLRRWPKLEDRIALFTRMMETHRTKLIMTFQFVPGAGMVVPMALGMTSISPLNYLCLDVISCVIWATVVPTIGYVFGAAAESMFGHVQGLVAVGLGVVVLVMFFLGKRKVERAIKLNEETDPS